MCKHFISYCKALQTRICSSSSNSNSSSGGGSGGGGSGSGGHRIIIIMINDKTCVLMDVAVPSDRNVMQMEAEIS